MRITRMQAAGVLMILTMIGLTGCANAAEEPLRVPTSASSSGEGAAGGDAAAGDATGGVTDSPSVGPSVLPSPGADPAADLAAGIAVYETYVAARNAIVIDDESTWAPLLEVVTGDYLKGTEDSLIRMRENGYTLHGDEKIISTSVVGVDENRVVFDVCLDGSTADTKDAAGNSVLDPSRDLVSALRVRAIPTGGENPLWKIDIIATRDDGPTC